MRVFFQLGTTISLTWMAVPADAQISDPNVKTCVEKSGHEDAELNPLPGDGAIVEGMLRLTHGRGLRERARGLAQIVRGVWAVRKR